jgi:uncharacterized protein YbjT (DUF2867 family)
MVREFLMSKSKSGDKSGSGEQVYAGVHSARSPRAHELFTLGATVIEMNCQNESLLLDITKNAKGVVIIPAFENRPDWDRKLRVCLSYLKEANPSVAIMLSSAAIPVLDNIKEEPSVRQLKWLAEAEAEFREIGKDKHWSVVRFVLPQEFLLHYSHLIQETGMLMLPTGQGKCPYISMMDVSLAVVELIHNPKQMEKSSRIYTLTGPEPLGGQHLAERISNSARFQSRGGEEGQIQFKNVNPIYAERYLRTEFSEKSSALVHMYLANFEVIKNSKLEKGTEDFKKITGGQPKKIDVMIKNFAQLFQP